MKTSEKIERRFAACDYLCEGDGMRADAELVAEVAKMEEELEELRHMKLAIDNTHKENLLAHSNPELWHDE